MGRLTIKLPKPLQRVEIIRSEDLINKEISAFIPEENIKDEFSTFSDGSQEDIATSLKPVPALLEFSEHYTITNSGLPINISLDKIPAKSMLIDDVKKEVQHAYDRGFDDAQQVTTNTFESQIIKYQEQIINFDNIIASLKEQYNNDIEMLEQSMVALSTKIASHIIGHAVESDSDIILTQVKKALSELDNEELFKIRLHPDNINILNENRIILDSSLSKLQGISIIADPGVGKGGCLLETSAGIIDARISTQLDKLMQKLSSIPVGTKAAYPVKEINNDVDNTPDTPEPEEDTSGQEPNLDDEISETNRNPGV